MSKIQNNEKKTIHRSHRQFNCSAAFYTNELLLCIGAIVTTAQFWIESRKRSSERNLIYMVHVCISLMRE